MIAFETMVTASAELSAGRLSSLDLCREIARRIKLNNHNFRAYSSVSLSYAEAEAIASDERRQAGKTLGPIDGIPIAVKDIINTMPFTCKAGMAHLDHYKPKQDAKVVKWLRDAGAVIMGVTETDNGAFGTTTPEVFNPVDVDRIAGGSSGGSAAAVAAGLAFGALGTDTGGSIRIPSACCSVYGFKPTFGRVSLDGVRPLGVSYDHVGSIARSIADLKILQSAIDPNLEFELRQKVTSPITIGQSSTYSKDATDIMQKATTYIFGRLQNFDMSLTNITLPTPESVGTYHALNVLKEAADYHLKEFPKEWRSYPEVAKRGIEYGLSVSSEDAERGKILRQTATKLVEKAFYSVDAIMVPTLPMDAPFRSWDNVVLGGVTMPLLDATIRYTSLFNQTGHPVVTLPGYIMPDGRALSMQLVGKLNSDAYLLNIAERIDSHLSNTVDYKNLSRGKGARMGAAPERRRGHA